MDVLEFSGKTIEDAVEKAAKHFNVSADQLNVDVLETPSRGFLGLGARDARIRVTYTAPEPKEKPVVEEAASQETEVVIEEAPALAEEAEKNTDTELDSQPEVDKNAEEVGIAFLAPIFDKLSVQPVVHISENDEEIRFALQGDDVGILIGRRGETLNALQYLLSLAINRNTDVHKRVILDCENYRERRAKTLEELALRMAAKARDTGRRVSLEPMSAAERRIVHLALDGEPGVKVESFGEEPNRRIVIYPKNN